MRERSLWVDFNSSPLLNSSSHSWSVLSLTKANNDIIKFFETLLNEEENMSSMELRFVERKERKKPRKTSALMSESESRKKKKKEYSSLFSVCFFILVYTPPIPGVYPTNHSVYL
jgi:predicted ATP-dependent protease